MNKTPEEIVDAVNAWIGWDLWEMDHDDICLDGNFSVEEIIALGIVLKQQQEANKK